MKVKQTGPGKKTRTFISCVGNKVRLRPLRLEDSELSMHWRNDPEIRDNLLSTPFPVTMEMEKNWIKTTLTDQSNSRIILAIETIFQHHLIGFIYLKDTDWVSQTTWFGIMIGEKEYQNQGMASEAMKMLFQYAFYRLNLRKISLEVAAFNEKAIDLYRSFDFREEGRLRNQVFMNGEFHDLVIMSIFQTDFAV